MEINSKKTTKHRIKYEWIGKIFLEKTDPKNK